MKTQRVTNTLLAGFFSLFVASAMAAEAVETETRKTKNTTEQSATTVQQVKSKNVKPSYNVLTKAKDVVVTKASDGNYKIDIKKLPEHSTAFGINSKGERVLIKVSTDKFLKNWDHNGFKALPPNVGVVGYSYIKDATGKTKQKVVMQPFVLSNPQYDSTSQSVIFDAKPLGKLNSAFERQKTVFPEALFVIDNCDYSCGL